MSKLFTAVLTTAFLAAGAVAPGLAQTPEKTETLDGKGYAQQQKMKECAAKWKEEKAAKELKGQEAYRKFMSGCLKSGRPNG